MKYKHKIAGTNESIFSSIDISIIFAMFALIMMAWLATKIEHTFIIKRQTIVPEFTIVGEFDVLPVTNTEVKKDAVKVGSFVSIAKKVDEKIVAEERMDSIKKIVPIQTASLPRIVNPPRIIYKTIPDYPTKSVENLEQGIVVVSALIQKNGKVSEVRLEKSSGYELLDKSAMDAVSQWIFEPASLSNQITEAWFKIPIRFQLKS